MPPPHPATRHTAHVRYVPEAPPEDPHRHGAPFLFFFFQAEDGIRYLTVTGVQTCALPISLQLGWRCMSTAAAPATCGDAMLVPLQSCADHWFPGSDERMSTPGAVTSGFICSDVGVGPLDENPAIMSAGPESPSVEAATVIAAGAVPGEPTE